MKRRTNKRATSGGVGASRTSEEAVQRATGRTRAEWFKLLDRFGAAKRAHREIADHLARKRRVPGWWAQMLTVDYEHARGLRQPGRRPRRYVHGERQQDRRGPRETAVSGVHEPELSRALAAAAKKAKAYWSGRMTALGPMLASRSVS